MKATALGPGKTSFENAVTLFLLGLCTERGVLPNLEEHEFEPHLVKNVLEMQDRGDRFECNLSKPNTRVVTQATDVLMYENLITNKGALRYGHPGLAKPIPGIDSDRWRRQYLFAGMNNLLFVRRVHVAFMSNVKIRITSGIETNDKEEPAVIFGEGTSSFHSTGYQRYVATFEQR